MSAPPPADRPQLGVDHGLVRAMAFAGGGFETAMQLGVVHALLVSQGKAPHAVIGESAGAINAVALAEVMQAGQPDPPDPNAPPPPDPAAERLAAFRRRAEIRVARFREMLDSCERAPGEIQHDLLPDAFQVEAQRPLIPIELPIHNQQERDQRHEAARWRAGLINFYNKLLAVPLSIGTITRFVRRYLGFEAAGDVAGWGAWSLVVVIEAARTWFLMGSSLVGLAPLVPMFTLPALARWRVRGHGSTADALISPPRWFQKTGRAVVYAASFLALLALWIEVGAVFLGLPFVMIRGVELLLLTLAAVWDAPATVVMHIEKRLWLIVGVLYGVGLVSCIAFWTWTRAWSALRAFNRTDAPGLIKELAFALGGLARLVLSTAALVLLSFVAFTMAIEPKYRIVEHWRQLLTAAASSAANAFWWGVLLLLVAAMLVVLLRRRKLGYRRRFLQQFYLERSLLSEHPLRELFVRVFDPHYYGRKAMDSIVDHALREAGGALPGSSSGAKTLSDYDQPSRQPRISVGLTVANVGSGLLEAVDQNAKVVDGLLAATAVAPVFPPVKMGDKLFVDGVNVANEPSKALLDMLRTRVNPAATAIHLYSVVPLPISRPALDDERKEYHRLVEVGMRALKLQRFRDALVQRRLTHLFTKAIPAARGARVKVNGDDFLRAWVVPIEPDAPLTTHERLLGANTTQARRDAIAETVADGCRAALEVMLHGTLGAPAAAGDPPKVVGCKESVQNYLQTRPGRGGIDANAQMPQVNLPGSGEKGPGVNELCAHCALRGVAGLKKKAQDEEPPKQSLVVRPYRSAGEVWPHEWENEAAVAGDAHLMLETRTREQIEAEAAARASGGHVRPGAAILARLEGTNWPENRTSPDGVTRKGVERPLVNLLFSGGVFRGVYQMGVLNALSEVDLQPDVIAGSSIGSITAAMIAQVFTAGHGTTDAARQLRRGRVARLSATYLALDRLILTDRFADFIRQLTLRAAASQFSVREADRVFRRFDSGSPARFNREARRVVAGLERLFYLSPFELLDLVKALRLGRTSEVFASLAGHVQEWLDRLGVGNQILGAEPLTQLINSHVIEPLVGPDVPPESVPFDVFLQRANIYFLATSVNLTRGSLEILGTGQDHAPERRANLLNALLASSAFPAVFRPRWSWEVMPAARSADQYIDGGTIDNLPLDAVAEFLHRAGGAIKRRPEVDGRKVPHLLFSASLEPDVLNFKPGDCRTDELRNDWPRLWGRVKKLGYNKKLELYAEAQQSLRRIVNEFGDQSDLLDLELVVARPRWLCGTFGFHPMLGFREVNQARSIAHGCATTLLELGRVAQDTKARAGWANAWGLDPDRLPKAPEDRLDPIVPDQTVKKGRCWFRENHECPFNNDQVNAHNLPPATAAALKRIYIECGEAKTHAFPV